MPNTGNQHTRRILLMPQLNYKTKPLAHQAAAVERFYDQPYGAFLCEMGTGKTKMVLDILGNSTADGIVVLAPNGLHLNWDAIEIGKHFPRENFAKYCWRGKPTTQKAKREMLYFYEAEADVKFFLMNIEAIRSKSGAKFLEDFIKSCRSVEIVVDESTCIKNPKAAQTKSAIKLGRLCDRRWILNGTPITQGPLDLWSQFNFLSTDALPSYKTFTGFKAMFAIEEIVVLQNRSFRKIAGYQNLERLKKDIAHCSLRLLKEDCMDLPEKTFQQHVVELTPEQKKVYSEIKDLCLSQLESGTIVSTTIALAKLTKLHQVLCGFVIDDDGNAIDIPNNRLAALGQIAESAQPLVIFCAYRHSVEQAAAFLREKYGQESVVEYHGDIDSHGREEAVRRFQDGSAKFFIGTSAAAKGITLHKAHTMVYYANTYSLEARLQSQDRIHRYGQNNACTYIDLVVPESLDQVILDRLYAKKDLADTVLTDLNKLFEL